MEASLKKLFSRNKDPLVGLEFLIYFTNEEEEVVSLNSPTYYCSMCKKHGNYENILQHFKSFPHLLKFLKLKFPSLVEAMNFPLFMNSRGTTASGILKLIASEVQRDFGGNPIVSEKIDEKWKICKNHFQTLTNQEKPCREKVKNIIRRIQIKRAELKFKIQRSRKFHQWNQNKFTRKISSKYHRLKTKPYQRSKELEDQVEESSQDIKTGYVSQFRIEKSSS